METTGMVVVEKVRGKSTVTRCFSKYPLKLIIPTKVGSSKTDAVWIYSLSYGGGFVSGDNISCRISVEDDCTAAFTTQASTKVYKSLGSKCSEQMLEAKIGRNALLAVIPDPVTCFASARYFQRQVFRVTSDSSLLIVDWFTSGRHESGEKWDFEFYRSTNNIFLDGEKPLFLDSISAKDLAFNNIKKLLYYEEVKHAYEVNVLLERGSAISIAESMCNYQVIAMIIILGPKLKCLQSQVKERVKKMMATNYLSPARTAPPQFHSRSTSLSQHDSISSSSRKISPSLIASCSVFGPKDIGLVVRVAALTTESVYDFLRENFMSLQPLLGVTPYC